MSDNGNMLGFRSFQELVMRLQPYFLSSSLGQPPGSAASATGNRTVTLTNRTTSGSPRTQDTVSLALIAGQVTYTFQQNFTNTPAISLGVHGPPPSAGTTLYILSIAPNAVTIKSTDATDTRLVDITATANPT